VEPDVRHHYSTVKTDVTIYLVLLILLSFSLGYVLAFTNATLKIGKSLSTAGTPTGYQDAITPPRFAALSLTVYFAVLAILSYGFWEFGVLRAFVFTMLLFSAVVVNLAVILPKSDSEHFRKIIIHSMLNRHADYLKAGDQLRASVMAELLEKLGIPVNQLVAQLKKVGDA